MEQLISVYVTHQSKGEAIVLANTLVQEKLVACVNIVDKITSIYEWKGKIENSEEVLMFLKTSALLYEKLKRRIEELHPYECPCILALPISDGNEKYLDWMKGQLSAY